MSDRPKTCITNLETGEVIVREYTDEEMEVFEAAKVARTKEDAAKASKAAKKAELLEKLGITEEEATLLLS
jgi:hypothetical protein